MAGKEITQLRICRREYNIASDEWQPLYIKRLGEILDNEIEKVEKETGVVDNYKLIILASLSLIDRMLKVEETKSGGSQLLEQEINGLNSQLEEVL